MCWLAYVYFHPGIGSCGHDVSNTGAANTDSSLCTSWAPRSVLFSVDVNTSVRVVGFQQGAIGYYGNYTMLDGYLFALGISAEGDLIPYIGQHNGRVLRITAMTNVGDMWRIAANTLE